MSRFHTTKEQSPALTFTAGIMVVALAAALTGMALDPRMIGGVSAWLKPAKFAISTAIFSATIAWIFTYLDDNVRPILAGRVLAAGLILEVVIIFIQACRGTSSHFNLSSPENTTIFSIMGIGIAAIWIATIAVFLAAMRQRFTDSAWGWALRLGLLITVIGSASGGLMLRTTPEQVRQHQMRRELTANGGHTVGAPDGGPGLPGVGWSTEHGDLRIPHFLGLHGLQFVPLFAWLVRRRRRPTALVSIAAASYFILFVILMVQALNGESLVQPGSATLTALTLWIVATAGAFGWASLPFPAPRLRQTESH